MMTMMMIFRGLIVPLGMDLWLSWGYLLKRLNRKLQTCDLDQEDGDDGDNDDDGDDGEDGEDGANDDDDDDDDDSSCIIDCFGDEWS